MFAAYLAELVCPNWEQEKAGQRDRTEVERKGGESVSRVTGPQDREWRPPTEAGR